MRKTDLPNAMIATVWALLLLSGIQGTIRIEERNVPGFPATGQLILYIGLPSLFLVLAILAAIFSRKMRWFYNFYPVVVVLIAISIFPVLMIWGGGV